MVDQRREFEELSDRVEGLLGRKLSICVLGKTDKSEGVATRLAVNGKVDLVVLSPEKLQGLRDSFLPGVKSGLFSRVIIDEAHVLDEWCVCPQYLLVFRPPLERMCSYNYVPLQASPIPQGLWPDELANTAGTFRRGGCVLLVCIFFYLARACVCVCVCFSACRERSRLGTSVMCWPI
jgi:hypothetical protein